MLIPLIPNVIMRCNEIPFIFKEKKILDNEVQEHSFSGLRIKKTKCLYIYVTHRSATNFIKECHVDFASEVPLSWL